MSLPKSWNCTSRFGECNFAFWKTHKYKLITNWTRKTVWLPINNIHEKICVKDVLNFTDSELSSQFCAALNQEKTKKKLCHNRAIQGARLIWKQKILLAICELVFIDQSEWLRYLLPFLHSITSFLHCVKEKLHCSQPIRIE